MARKRIDKVVAAAPARDGGGPQNASAPAAPPPLEIGLAGALALCCALVFLLLAHGNFYGTDEISVFETTESLWTEGSLAVEPGGPHVFPGRDGRHYTHFAVGQSVLALPLYGLGALARATLPADWVAALAGPDWSSADPARPRGDGRVEIAAVARYGPLASAVLVALFFLFQRQLGVPLRPALAASALLGGTSYVAGLSGYFLLHVTEAIAVLGSLLCLHRHRIGGGLATLAAGSFLASSTLLIREPAALAGPGLAGYALWVAWARHRRRPVPAALALAVPFAVVLASFAWLNHVRWGTWLRSPMMEQVDLFLTPIYVGLWGFLLSPGASVFVFAPLLLLLPWTLPDFWRRQRAECVAVLAIALTLLLVCARFDVWTGVWSAPGPRYLFLTIPLLMLPLGGWLAAPPTRRARIALFALSGIGAGVQLLLVLTRWPDIILGMNYREFADPDDFVFLPHRSPLLGAWQLVRAGELDVWLWRLARGWPGRAGQPGVALLLLAGWAGALAGAALLLRQRCRQASRENGSVS